MKSRILEWDREESALDINIMVVRYLTGKVKNILLDKDDKTTVRRYRQNPSVKSVTVR